ncbi:MAG: hypothetical protein QOJ11_401 [Frankiales bacterium]|jgi:osmotically-inducible protein OsmY|nr:hypothetical protein [Frankiales bacterium]
MNIRTRSIKVTAAVTAPVAAAVGAGLSYLFDPDRGKARRRKLADQAASRARHQARRVGAQARYQRGRLRGAARRAIGGGVPYPTDDVDVKQLIHQALRAAGIAMGDVSIEVSERTAVLRGQVSTRQEMELAEQIACRVAGVHGLESYLHLPGEPAPNKVTSLRAVSHNGG